MGSLNNDEQHISGRRSRFGREANLLSTYVSNLFVSKISTCSSVSCLISSENYLTIPFAQSFFGAEYCVALTPIEGASNAASSIFTIFKSKGQNIDDLSSDRIVAAGYILYVVSLQLILSDGDRTSLFVYSSPNNKYILTNNLLKVSREASNYSVNVSGDDLTDVRIQDFIGNSKHGVKVQCTGSLVSDFHKNLIEGGVSIYLKTDEHPNGKLGLLYTCFPLAFIIKACGGLAVSNNNNTLNNRLLFKEATFDVHQKSNLIVGSVNMIRDFMKSRTISMLKVA